MNEPMQGTCKLFFLFLLVISAREKALLTEQERFSWTASLKETLLVAIIFLMSFCVDYSGQDRSVVGWFNLQWTHRVGEVRRDSQDDMS